MERINVHDRSVVKFCVDKVIDGKPYPNLATLQAQPYTAEWRKFSVSWPYSEPVHFFEYLDQENIPYQLVEWTQADRSTFYPISISFFDFSIDWFELLPAMIREKLRSKTLSLWFFYSEGDNPIRIKTHLVDLFQRHDIDPALIQFTSANSAAADIEGFHHFVDDECLYRLRNTSTPASFHERPRSRKFTALVRTHKWWRATTMARIWNDRYHETGFFSYGQECSVNESIDDVPISIDNFYRLRDRTYEFISKGPFKADDLSADQHNDHNKTVLEHYSDSYLNVILETHFDIDGTDGTFLTEKTFKPVKNCQPFIIFGPKKSCELLRQMGYRTFDHVIDHSYDTISDPTQRWNAVYQEFQRLMHLDLHRLYVECKNDLIWNQQLFLDSKGQRLNTLLKKITDYAKR